MKNERDEAIDAETVDEITREDLMLMRRPSTPLGLDHLSTMKSGAIEVIEARVLILDTLRRAAIRATSPPDWLLFKSPAEQGGQIVGYLQDCGADRVRDLYGIEIFGISSAEKIVSNDPGIFHYLIRGSGRCKLTGQVLEEVEGGRSSTDDFCKGKAGLELDLAVRKAARANLDGGITRELAGMKSVPAEDIAAAWEGTPKKIEDCRRGRGFGTAAERVGARSDKGPDVDPPICPHCGSAGVVRSNSRGQFYGCPKYQSHADQRWTVDVSAWLAEVNKKKAATAAATPPAGEHGATAKPNPESERGRPSRPASSSSREPGQEG